MSGLTLPQGSRPARLLAELDARYFEFADALPPPLREMARLKSTYAGSPGEESFAGVSAVNPGLTSTPWLFWQIFEDLPDGTFLQLAEAGAMVVLASIVLDHLVDGQPEQPQPLSMLHQALHAAGAARFRSAMPASTRFWAHFERLSAEHLAGLAAELEARADPEQFSPDNFLAMVRGKFAPIVISIAALAEALGRPEVVPPIETSIKHLAVASQLLDDIGDWQDDVGARHLTFYLSRIGPADAWAARGWPSTAELQDRIDADWLDAAHLRTVIEWLDKAVEAVKELNCPAWVEYVQDYRALADRHLTAATARHLARSLRPLA